MALEGDLGAGKTEFVRGACEELGVDSEVVTSPTFTLVNEYDTDAITVFHIDAYRLESETEFFDLGYEDYLNDASICFVEWPERLPSVVPADAIRVKISHVEGGGRRLQIDRPGV